MRLFFATLAGVGLMISAFSQEQPAFEKKPFKDTEGNVFWPLAMPVYIQLTTSPDSKEGLTLTQVKEPNMKNFANPMKWDGHGKHFVKHVDNENQKLSESAIAFPVQVDGLPPVSALELLGATRYASGKVYFGKNLSLSVKAKDEMSGLGDIYLSVNGAPFEKHSSPVPLTQEKEYTVKYFAVDKVGNAEPTKWASFTLDLSPPTSSHELIGNHIDNSILSPRTFISIAGHDEASGVRKTEYYFDEQKPALYNGKISLAGLADGEHTLHYYSFDNIGNVESPKEFTFYLDAKGPEVTSSFDANFAVANGRSYAAKGTLVSLEATDNKSGVKSLFYSVNGSAEQSYTGPFALPDKQGTYSIRYRAIDQLNNAGATFTNNQISRIYVDDTPPVVAHTIGLPKIYTRDTLFVTQQALFTITSFDAESGGAIVDYKIDNGGEVTYEKPFKVAAEGKHSISYSGTDLVNNSAVKTTFFVVDNSAPEIFMHTSLEKIGTQKLVNKEEEIPVYASGTMLYMAATDKLVGTRAIYYSFNQLPEALYTQPVKLMTKGVHALKIKAIDYLGNTRILDTVEFVVQ